MSVVTADLVGQALCASESSLWGKSSANPPRGRRRQPAIQLCRDKTRIRPWFSDGPTLGANFNEAVATMSSRIFGTPRGHSPRRWAHVVLKTPQVHETIFGGIGTRYQKQI